jgi:hypothetical protein
MSAAELSKLVGVPQATMYNKTNQVETRFRSYRAGIGPDSGRRPMQATA